MELIQLIYGLPKDNVTAIMMLFKITKSVICSPDGNTNFFLQEDILVPYKLIDLVPYKLSAILVPYKLSAILVPYKLGAILVPYKLICLDYML